MRDCRSQPNLPDAFCGYEIEDPRLGNLYSKGKSLQWDAAERLDWASPVDPGSPLQASAFPLLSLPIFQRLSEEAREKVTASFTQTALSQFLHGEQGALMVAARLVDAAPDYDAKLYAATQTMDEARHVEVFNAYLRRTGGVQPVTRALQEFIEEVLRADTWLKVMIGMQVIVEGAALASFHTYRQRCNDPLLSELLDGVIRDEARHVGFGNLYARRAVRDLHPDDREAMADFCFEAVLTFSSIGRDMMRTNARAMQEAGLSLDDVIRDGAEFLRAGRRTGSDSVRDGISDFILPTLERTGLLTPRVQEKFARARFHASPNSPLLDQLEAIVADA